MKKIVNDILEWTNHSGARVLDYFLALLIGALFGIVLRTLVETILDEEESIGFKIFSCIFYIPILIFAVVTILVLVYN